MPRQVNQRTFDLIKSFEGYEKALPDGSCKAYLDTIATQSSWKNPDDGGLWTIGYGCTEGVYEGLVWTKAQAEAALRTEINKHASAVENRLTVPVTDNQFGALVSISYNVGTHGIRKIIDRVNEGHLKEAADSFLLYGNSNGHPVPGLVRRRKAERNLFLWEEPKALYSVSQKLQVSWWTRFTTSVSATVAYGMSFLNWDFVNQAKQFASDHTGLIVLGVGGTFLIVMKLIENMTINDFNSDRYVPSGMASEGSAVWKEESDVNA